MISGKETSKTAQTLCQPHFQLLHATSAPLKYKKIQFVTGRPAFQLDQ
jgi:hypothetical protein